MTDREIRQLGPVLSRSLRRFRDCVRRSHTRQHVDNYCRALLSDLPRKSVEPMALASGTTVRTLQVFLAARMWDQEQAHTILHEHLASNLYHRLMSCTVKLVRHGLPGHRAAVKENSTRPRWNPEKGCAACEGVPETPASEITGAYVPGGISGETSLPSVT